MTHTSKEGRAEFVCDTAGTTLIVYVRGEIDHHTAVAIRGGIDTLLYERRPARLMLDLSAVGFMDSSGLGLIMGRLAVMRELGGVLVVANPSREVWGILTLAGMERLVAVEFTEGHEPPPSLGGGAGTSRRQTSPVPTGGGRSGGTPRPTGTPRSRHATRADGEPLSTIEVIERAPSSGNAPQPPRATAAAKTAAAKTAAAKTAVSSAGHGRTTNKTKKRKEIKHE